jgi:hypothetical protein
MKTNSSSEEVKGCEECEPLFTNFSTFSLVKKERKNPSHPSQVFTEKKPPSERITTGTIHEGGPTDAALEIAERIYNNLADMKMPCFEGAILGAAGRDAAFSRSVLFRLVMEGFLEYRGGGAYQIFVDPPKAHDKK